MPVLYCSTYGRVRPGSGLASATVPKFDGRLAKLISQVGSFVKSQPRRPCATSSRFLSVQGRLCVIVVALAGSYSSASVVVAAAMNLLNPNFNAVLPLPWRSYTMPVRGDQLFHVGISLSSNAGMLAKRPD